MKLKTGAFLLALALAAPAAAAAWKAGAARVAITPSEPIWMAGFASRTRPSEGVRQPLYAKALALDDGSGRPAVLVTLDLVAIEREMAQAVTARLRERYGLTRDRVLLNVSHTHSGPVAGLVLMPLYELTAGQRDVIRRYTAALMDNIVKAAGASLKDLAPATLEFGQGLAGIAVNRRRVANRSLPGPVDHDLPVLRVRNAAGKVRAIVAGYACHATVLNDYRINGDWPGYAQEEIEKAHPGAIALFVQGAGADSNALPRGSVEAAQRYGKILAAGVAQVLGAKMKALDAPLTTVYETVDAPFETPPGREELRARLNDKNVYQRRWAARLLETIEKDGALPAAYPYPVQLWKFGSGLKLIALAGEVVADYALLLKARHGWDDTWVAGYSNDILAYIPSRRVRREGGYEGGEAMIYFGRPGPFKPDIEDIIVRKVDELVVGRP